MFIVAALYRFTKIEDPAAIRGPLLEVCKTHNVKGTLLLAREGINGTIAGTRGAIDAVLNHLGTVPGLAGLTPREGDAREMPFGRMKVRLKQEIVTMGQADVDPSRAVGRYVDPEDWNELITAEDVAVIDVRNDYEVVIGSFDGAIDPKTQVFSDFTRWWQENEAALKGKRLALFCTGGIRCEKATSWLVAEGVEDVHHLKGGILGYLETVPPEDSTWHGECFVFDQRVSVGHGLVPGDATMCHACRRPVTTEGRHHPAFEQGVSCSACIGEYSDSDRLRFREREKQIALAATRGEMHLGD